MKKVALFVLLTFSLMFMFSCTKDVIKTCSSCSNSDELVMPKRAPDYRYTDEHDLAQAKYNSLSDSLPCVLMLTYEQDYEGYCCLFDDIYIGTLNENGDCVF